MILRLSVYLLAAGCVAKSAVARPIDPLATWADTLHDVVPPVAPLVTLPVVAREFRAVWISPVSDGGAGDWPSHPGMSVAAQQAELCALLDHAKAIGLNAVILHVRPAADALYDTPLAPWSAFLTGVSGRNPGYDPLAFAIQEAHAHGLQLHAWFNPFRAMLPNFAGRAAASHVTHTHPEWVRRYGTQTWIDPGIPAARHAVLAAIVDVVRRYDVDGVHLDDYFYPYRERQTITKRVHRHSTRVTREIEFPDDQSWRQYGQRAGWTSRADWRRDNVNTFIQTLYARVKAEKPWVLVGISPFGIWRSGTPDGITGLDAYGEIYADSRLWLTSGWLDYLVPQLYWPTDGAQHRFARLDTWWRETAQNPRGRYIWPGLATFLVRSGRFPPDEMTTQITAMRDHRVESADIPGHVHFRMNALSRDTGALGDVLHHAVYTVPALVPAFPWLGDDVPSAPVVTHVQGRVTGFVRYAVTPGTAGPVAWWLIQRWTAREGWTTAMQRATAGAYLLEAPQEIPMVIGIRAIGRTGAVSPPTVLQRAGAPQDVRRGAEP